MAQRVQVDGGVGIIQEGWINYFRSVWDPVLNTVVHRVFQTYEVLAYSKKMQFLGVFTNLRLHLISYSESIYL